MPEKMTTLSQSALQDYADCARRYELRHIERMAYPAVESEPALENERHQQEGELFHRLAQQALLGLHADKISRLAAPPNLSRWWENFSASFLPLKEKAFADAILFPEIILSARLADFRLLAKFDLVAISPDGQAHIYDWKTYRKRPRNENMSARWQTRVYMSMLAQAGGHFSAGNSIPPEKISMRYWYPEFPSEPAHFTYSAERFAQDWQALEKLATEISQAKNFPLAADEKKCAFCTYRSYCDRGVHAGKGADGELEIEAVFSLDFDQIAEIEI